MRRPRYSLGALLLSVPVVAITTLSTPRYLQLMEPPSTVDLTAGASSRCQVHDTPMRSRTVPLQRSQHYEFSPKRTEEDVARLEQFPHAHEPRAHQTLATRYQSAKIWTCPDCTAAREQWFLEQQKNKWFSYEETLPTTLEEYQRRELLNDQLGAPPAPGGRGRIADGLPPSDGLDGGD